MALQGRFHMVKRVQCFLKQLFIATCVVIVPALAHSTTTTSFQDGVFPTSSYSGTRDTYLASSAPSTNYGPTTTTLWVDGDGGTLALLRWKNLTIPAGSTVLSATITLNVTNPTTGTYNLYALKRDWWQDNATWNSYGPGSNWEIPGAKGTSDRGTTVVGTITAPTTGPRTISLNAAGIALVRSWVNSPSTNNGILIGNPTVTDGMAFGSKEAPTALNRPKLTVTYGSPSLNFNFSLTNGGSKSVTRGASVSNTISASLVSGTARAVSFSAAGLPTGATASFSSTACLPTCSAGLTLSTTTSTPTGTYAITVTSTGGGVTKTTSFSLTVNPTSSSFYFSLSNGGNQSVTQGASVSHAIQATPVSGTARAVSFSAAGLPTGATAPFLPTACSPTCSTTLALCAAASTPP